MKTSRQSLLTQRALIERKLKPWNNLRHDKAPPSGWIKAMRVALGMNTRQLAERLGVQQSTITRLEKREAAGNVTLKVLNSVARAMNAQLVYALVPTDEYRNIDAIIAEQAQAVAAEYVRRTEHSMRLEKQGAAPNAMTEQIKKLADQLKSKGDPQIWWQPGRARVNRRK